MPLDPASPDTPVPGAATSPAPATLSPDMAAATLQSAQRRLRDRHPWRLRWRRLPRLRFSIVTTLAASFGSLVVVAMGIAIYLLFSAAQSGTTQLTGVAAQAVINIVTQNLRHQLDPAQNQLQALARFILSDHLDVFDDGRISDLLMGTLASNEQMDSVLFVRSDLRVMSINRSGNSHDDYQILETTGNKARIYATFLDRARTHRSAFWGTPFYSQARKQAVIPLYMPVRRSGGLLGVLRATVTIEALSQHISEGFGAFHGIPFAINADGFVIAHPALNAEAQRAGHLLRPSDIGDQVLAAFRFDDPTDRNGRDISPAFDFRVQRVSVGGQDYVIFYRTLTEYEDMSEGNRNPRPWIVGSHITDTIASSFIDRITLAALGGGVVMLLAVGLAILIGRRITQPIAYLAEASEKIARLELDGSAPLPGSRLREVDIAITAFNRMRTGLGWLATYVPRALLPLLVRTGSTEDFDSGERDVTILFTDIVGFTAIGQKLDAPDLAAFLSRHFSLLEEAIDAEGGAIDKYIGDSVMAFWGAPARQPDHVMRACRAALAIARILAADNERRAHKALSPVRVRIGIETGTAIAGNIGAPGRINYTLVGDKVNLAQRFEQFAKTVDDGRADAIIIVSADVAAALPPELAAEIEVEPLGAHLLPGRNEEMELYRLIPAAVTPASS